MLLEQFVNEIKFSLPAEYPYIDKDSIKIIPRKRVIAPIFPDKCITLRHRLEKFVQLNDIQTSLTIAGIINYAVEQMPENQACAIVGGRNGSPFLYACALSGNAGKTVYFSHPIHHNRSDYKHKVERYVYPYKKDDTPVFWIAPTTFFKWYKYSFNPRKGSISTRIFKFSKSEMKFGLVLHDYYYDSDIHRNRYRYNKNINTTLLETEDVLAPNAYILMTGTSYQSRWVQLGIFQCKAKYEYDVVFHNAPDITKMDSIYTYWNGLTILKKRG